MRYEIDAFINAKNAPALNRISHCTRFRHTPVDELHSIENTRDKVSLKSLTSKIEGVKTHSFFDNFAGFFRIGREAETESSPLQRALRREARRYYDGSERTAQLRGNNKVESVEGETESRGVERIFRFSWEREGQAEKIHCMRKRRWKRSARVFVQTRIEKN
ncbi:MAG: hypothetical protein P4M04_06305 [Acidobacteriota bacterium]|nr:hypothetical protein [Acidobacteriota bacterium]